MPLMTNKQIQSWLKIIEDALGESPDSCIYKNNINPVRTGLQLYKVISQVQDSFDMSTQSINTVQETI